MVGLLLIFWETSTLFSTVATPIYNPTNGAHGVPFLLISTCLFLVFLIIVILRGVSWYLIVFFFLIFYCKIFASKYCAGFCHTSTRISHRNTYVPSLWNLHPIFHPSRLSQSTGLSSQCHTANFHWCPPVNEWIHELWYIYTMKCYSALKKNALSQS